MCGFAPLIVIFPLPVAQFRAHITFPCIPQVFLEIVERAKKEEDEINGKKGGKKKRKKTGDGQGDEDSGVEMQPVRTRSPVDPERVEFSSPSPPVENGGRALSHNEVRTALPLHPSKDQE